MSNDKSEDENRLNYEIHESLQRVEREKDSGDKLNELIKWFAETNMKLDARIEKIRKRRSED